MPIGKLPATGLKWVEYRDCPEDVERAHLAEAVRLHTEVTGTRPTGYYLGRCSMNTVRLAAEEGGFDYVSDAYDDDLPYWQRIGRRDQLVIPYTLDCNDMRFATPQGFNSGDQFYTYLKDTFDALYAEGGKMMSIGLHCRLIGRPGRVQALRRFIEYAQSKSDVWFAKRIDIARHWQEHHPAPAAWDRPSEMGQDSFVAAYGSIFEHSPWVAEHAHRLELGPTHDSAVGLHNALCRAFRRGDEAARLDVLTAHPDLAGKLAAAKRLTAESTAEQAGAGLDALTADELATFSDLNERYTKKFGFPFIIAVKDNTKASIMSAFQDRLNNDREAEFATACAQVERIAWHRLQELLP